MSAGAGYAMGAQAAGGTTEALLGLLGANQDAKGVFDAWMAELKKQGGYAAQAQALMGPAIQHAGSAAALQDMHAAAANRMQQYASIGQVPLSVTPSYNPYQARDTSYLGLLGGQRANLESYGDWLHQAKIENMQTQRGLDVLSNFSAGQLRNVYPYTVYEAQHAGDTARLAGALIGTTSDVAGAGMMLSSMNQQPSFSTMYPGPTQQQIINTGYTNPVYNPGQLATPLPYTPAQSAFDAFDYTQPLNYY